MADDDVQWDFSSVATSTPEPPPGAPVSPAAAPPPAKRRRWLTAAVILVLVLAAGATSAFGVSEMRRADRLEDEKAEQRKIKEVAGAFGEALLTYDYQDLTSALDRVRKYATEQFITQYTDAFENGLDAAIVQMQATSSATVREVYVTDVVGGAGRAVVTIDSEVRSTAATRKTISSYLDMALVQENGEWKVDSVTSVGALDQQLTPAPDSSTTSTTVATTSSSTG